MAQSGFTLVYRSWRSSSLSYLDSYFCFIPEPRFRSTEYYSLCVLHSVSWICFPESLISPRTSWIWARFFTTCSSTFVYFRHGWWNKSNLIVFQMFRYNKNKDSFTLSLILFRVCISCFKFASVVFCFSSQQTVRATVCLWTTAVWAAAAPTRTSSPATPRGPWTCRTPGTSSSSTTRTRTTAAGTDDTTCPTSSSPVGISGSHHGLCINKMSQRKLCLKKGNKQETWSR